MGRAIAEQQLTHVAESAIATYAAATYSAWASETGIAMTDIRRHRIPDRPGDGCTGADTGNTAAAWQALTDYHVLRRLQTVISARSDFDATAIKAGRSYSCTCRDDQRRSQPRPRSQLSVTGAAAGPARSTGQPTGSGGPNRMTTETPDLAAVGCGLIKRSMRTWPIWRMTLSLETIRSATHGRRTPGRLQRFAL